MKDILPRTPIRSIPEHLPSVELALAGLSGSNSEEVELREYWRVLWKYKLLIGVLVLVGGFFALLYGFTVTPQYTAESTIRISTYEPVLGATRVEDMLQEKSREANYLETQIQEIKSFSLADKVLSDPAIREGFALRQQEGKGVVTSMLLGLFGQSGDDGIAPVVDQVTGYTNPVTEIKDYLESVQIRPVRRTSLVVVGATSENPGLASLIANKHALSYIDWVRDKRMEQQSRGLKFLVSQADELRGKVADIEREIADYAESNSIVTLNKDENITVQKMSRLNELLTNATAKRIEIEHAFREAESALTKNSAGYDDSSTQTLRSELAKFEAEYQQLSAKFTDSYPRMRQLKSQIRQLRESIESQRVQIVAGLRSKYMAVLEEEKNLKEELEQQKSQTFELSKRQVQYNVLNRDLTSSRELLQNILRQIKETSLTVENNSSNVSIVDYASVPRSPTFPKKKLLLLLGLLAGAGLGVGMAFLLNYLDNTVRTPEDVTRILHLPALGVVPSFGLEEFLEGAAPAPKLTMEDDALLSRARDSVKGPPLKGTNLPVESLGSLPPIVYLSNPRSLASEAYRTIRTGVLLSQAGEPPRTILVSSAQSSEGKTTSTVNLTASLASAGGKVVLVDADLRRPSVYKHLNLPESLPGLVEVLTGLCSLEEVMVHDRIRGVTVIPSGRIPPNPAELLGSSEMVALLDKLAAQFDYVLIDSPPILPVTDSVILSRFVDGVIIVVKGASTPRKVARDAKDRLRAVGARLLGVILNDVDVTGGDYYYYNRYYHSYYREDQTRAKDGSRAVGAS